MTPDQWKDQFAPDISPAIRARMTANAVAAYLDARDPTFPAMTTTELVEELWPIRQTPAEFIDRRKAMIGVVLQLAKAGLQKYARKSDTPRGRFMGRMRYPYLWAGAQSHTPVSVAAPSGACCPTCGKLI